MEETRKKLDTIRSEVSQQRQEELEVQRKLLALREEEASAAERCEAAQQEHQNMQVLVVCGVW